MEERLVLTVRCPPPGAPRGSAPVLELNSRPVTGATLAAALDSELRRRAGRTVYVAGEGCLEVGDLFRTIDIVQGAWPGLRIVLLTPQAGATPTRTAGPN